MNPKNRYYPVPKPDEAQINERAVLLAKEAGYGRVSRELANLIRWPSWATPPFSEFAYAHMIYVAELKEKAKAQLTAEMAALPRVRIDRRKRIRRRNKQKWWTSRPMKHGQNPPLRRRGFLPPIPIAQDPPGEEQEKSVTSSAKRPSRRDRRRDAASPVGKACWRTYSKTGWLQLFDN